MTTAFLRKTLTAFFLLLCTFAFSQHLPNTLLWKISGRNLSQPSYLYGTMHLQDKRLFNFGDSVYSAIQNTEGFATEVDFRDYFDSMMNQISQKVEMELVLAKSKVNLNRKRLPSSADSILKKFGIKGNAISKKDLKTIRDQRMQKFLQRGEMPTIVDGFLFGLALRLDKWVGGIEDVADQMNLMDELGADLEPESVLQPDTVFEQGIEEMVKTYTAQDLQKIDRMLNGYSARDLVLIQRNVKMARRMDSLSALRSMFFAVGAAHLPGDSGVISLLRSRGFVVEPVFSKTTTPGSDYASHLKKAPWQEVEGDEGIYTVSMPAKPSLINLFGDAVKMRMCFDLTTMTMYMVGSGAGYNAKAKSLDDVVKEMVRRSAGENAVFTQTAVTHAGLEGKEASYSSKDGYFRIQVFAQDKTIFILVSGGQKKNLLNGDVDYFFSSFKPGNTVIKHEWKEFSLAEKGFSVRMPGNPSINATIDKNIPEISPWQTVTYQTVDPQTGYFYLLQVRDTKPDRYLNPDSTLFAAMQADYETRVDKLSLAKTGSHQGYPALYMNGYMKKVEGEYKVMDVLRGNRLYVLTAGAPKGSDMTDIDSFLNSFTLLPYQPTAWTSVGDDGFQTVAVVPFKKLLPDSTKDTKQFSAHYISKNPANGIVYEVYKNVLPPFYWISSDSAYFNGKLEQYRSAGDSLLSRKDVKIGSLKGIDFTLTLPGYSSNKKARLFMNGDTLYTLYALLPAMGIDSAVYEPFFSQFRVSNETAPTLYSSKAAQLLEALTTKDSAQFETASESLELVAFDKTDLPLLHKSLLHTYYDSATYYNTNYKLVENILPFADSTTLAFVKKEYPLLDKEQESVKLPLLTLLAKQKTDSSYSLLKSLLAMSLPVKGNNYQLQYALRDSLLLTKTLFPTFLQYVGDSLFSSVVVTTTNELLDSNLLNKTVLLPYEKSVTETAANVLAEVKDGSKESWELADYARLLGQLNTAKANELLHRMLLQKDAYLKQTVIMALLKNGLSVPVAEVAAVAADKEQRLYFYEALQKEKKENLFPALYATQKSLAESDVYNLFINDDYDKESFTLSYIGQRMAAFNGKQSLFYLFKVQLPYDNEKKDYLAVAGPYTPGAKEKLTRGDATGYYTDETFLPQKTDKLLKAYLLSITSADN